MVPCESMELLGSKCTSAMIAALTSWCSDLGTLEMPAVRQDSRLSLMPEHQAKERVPQLRPLGLVSTLQEDKAKTMLEAVLGDLLRERGNSDVSLALMAAAAHTIAPLPCVRMRPPRVLALRLPGGGGHLHANAVASRRQ